MTRPTSSAGGGAVLRLDDATAQLVTDRFATVATDLGDLPTAIASVRSWIEPGAGVLGDSISSQSATYAAGWETGLDILSTSASLISSNTNALSIDLRAADQDIAAEISILPPEPAP